MKLEYFVVYENSSEEFDIELHRIKVKVIQGQGHCRCSKVFPIYHNTNCQVLCFNLVKLGTLYYVHRILIYKIYECRYA